MSLTGGPRVFALRYAMLCGCLPFDEPEMEVLYDRIIAGEYDFSPAPHLSHAARDLIMGLLRSPPEHRLTAREVLSHKWMRQTGGAASLVGSASLSVGLVGAVVDPACRQLVRRMEAEYGIPQREVIEALRRGERSPLTATYWLLRQRELRKGSIQRYVAHLPRPPPPRTAAQRRRPVPSHIRAAAAKLPAVAAVQPTGLLTGAGALRLDNTRGWAGHGGSHSHEPHILAGCGGGGGSSTHRGAGGRHVDKGGGTPGITQPLMQRPREEVPLYVHASGALSDRTDRDGHSRRLHELEAGPVRRAPGVPVRNTGATRESQLTHISDLGVPGVRGAESRHRGPPSHSVGGITSGIGAISMRSPARDSANSPKGKPRGW
jgi:hypothetical protein